MRLFLALEPPEPLRQRLGELAELAQARCGGRRMPDESLHLTLAFLGEVAEERADELAQWVGAMVIPHGEWGLDSWGYFRRPGILWVGSQAHDLALTSLHEQLWDGLEEQGLCGRPDRFIPHVTLLRRATYPPDPTLPAVSLAWHYTRVALIRSVTTRRGSHYHCLARSLDSSGPLC